MDEITRNQVGSPSRDNFKRLHKNLSRRFYACDIDFVLVEKEPYPDIVLALDYKQSGDGITFSETIAYVALIRRGIPVYIVTGHAEAGLFRIDEFVGGHYGKPRNELRHVATVKSWDEFAAWEDRKRDEYKKRYSP